MGREMDARRICPVSPKSFNSTKDRPAQSQQELPGKLRQVVELLTIQVDSNRLRNCLLAGRIQNSDCPPRQLLYWAPDGLPLEHTHAVTSSRLGRRLDRQNEWFDAFRTCLTQLARGGQIILSGRGMSTDPYLRRATQLFGIPLIRFQWAPLVIDASWIREQLRVKKSNQDSAATCFVFSSESVAAKTGETTRAMDPVVLAVAREATVLSVRKNGLVAQATRQRLEFGLKTRLLISPNLTPKNVAQGLLSLGATGWYLGPSRSKPIPRRQTIVNQAPCTQAVRSIRLPPDQYLIHWTRCRHGPWPDQTTDDYLDDLIFQREPLGRQPIDVLKRIIKSGWLLGSTDHLRSPEPVICFSEVPFTEIRNHRRFRSHLARWDFEPYGLAILRSQLRHLGARPVIYGDETTWQELSEQDQPYFQHVRAGGVDWTSEKEWRLVGDLELPVIGAQNGFVFVNSAMEISQISPISNWPITVVPAGQ